MGVTEPKATFSPCFGGPFLVWHPGKYAELLSQRITKHKSNVWLINTGWTGGGDGVGSRIKLQHTRAIVDAIHSGVLLDATTETDEVFGLNIVTSCPDVPSKILVPRSAWENPADYDRAAHNLAGLFRKNFTTYADGVRAEVLAAGPQE